MTRHRRNVAYNLIGYAVPLALSLLTVPLYLSVLGIERFGVLQMAWVFLGYFGVLDLGLGKATAYFLAKTDGDVPPHREVLYTSLVLSVGIGLVIGAVFYLIAIIFFSMLFQVSDALRGELLPVLTVLALAVPVGVLTSTYTSALQGRGQFLTANALNMGSTLLFQIAPLLTALFVGPQLTVVIPVAIGARLVGLIAFAAASTRVIGAPGRRLVTMPTTRVLMGYGGWAAVSSLLAPLLQIADRMAIGAKLGAVAVATYSIPLQFAQRMPVLPSSVALALFPRLTAATPEERKRITRENMVGMGALLLALLAVALPILPTFLQLWLGSHYQPELGRTAIVLFVGYFFNGLALYPCVQLQAAGAPRKIAESYAYQIPVYFVLLYLLMSGFGVVGAAAALTVRFGMDLVLLQAFASRRWPPRETMVQTLALALVACASGLLPMTPLGIGAMAVSSALAIAAAAATVPRRLRDQAMQVAARLLRGRTPAV